MGSLSGHRSLFQSFKSAIDGTLAPQYVAGDILRETIGYDIESAKFCVPTFTAMATAGYLGHKVVSKIGVNRTMPKVMGWKIEL